MSIHNRYSDVPLTEEDFTTFDAQFAMIEEIISALQEPNGLILRRVPKLGFKSDTFTRDALMLAAKHEGLLPRDLDVQELEAQMKLRDELKSRALRMKLMARKMEMIVQLLGSDVFSGALAAYKSMKANHRGTLNEQLRELGQLFRKRKKREDEKNQGPETRDEGLRQTVETARNEDGAPERGATGEPSPKAADLPDDGLSAMAAQTAAVAQHPPVREREIPEEFPDTVGISPVVARVPREVSGGERACFADTPSGGSRVRRDAHPTRKPASTLA